MRLVARPWGAGSSDPLASLKHALALYKYSGLRASGLKPKRWYWLWCIYNANTPFSCLKSSGGISPYEEALLSRYSGEASGTPPFSDRLWATTCQRTSMLLDAHQVVETFWARRRELTPLAQLPFDKRPADSDPKSVRIAAGEEDYAFDFARN
ncbi:hypothetical protein PG994_004811 [Apiospora phragmitis]|uniref:Uncharacterized protein n=1 Tax=Apiospora phragmitis TaxID=2905665 RepID=A0ABR1VSV9_9PEZI